MNELMNECTVFQSGKGPKDHPVQLNLSKKKH